MLILKRDKSDSYNKTEVDDLIRNFITDTEMNNALFYINNDILAINVKFNDYYTKIESDIVVDNL